MNVRDIDGALALLLASGGLVAAGTADTVEELALAAIHSAALETLKDVSQGLTKPADARATLDWLSDTKVVVETIIYDFKAERGIVKPGTWATAGRAALDDQLDAKKSG